MTCNDPDCKARVVVYRQCADLKCKLELGYCDAHGGDERGQRDMAAHIDGHRAPVSPSG